MPDRSLAWMAIVAATAVGCDAKTPPKEPSAAPEPTVSRFLSDIGSRDYPAAEPPAEPVLPRFDFSGAKIYAYDYHQRVATTTDMGGMGPKGKAMGQSMSADGLLVLKPKGDGTGTLLLKDMKATMSMAFEEGKPEKSMTMQQPTMAVPDVKEDGSMDGGAANAQPLLKLLFPMPPKGLRPGESGEVPISIPFNAMGSLLTVKGTATTTLAGFVTIDGRTCARLETAIDVSRLDVPKEVEGKHAFSTLGKSIYYYDLEARAFVSGETAILMKMRAESKAPKITRTDGSEASEMPETFRMAMVSDNLIRIVRNPERAAKEAEGK